MVITSIIVVLAFSGHSNAYAEANNNSIKVSIPTFNIVVNGETVDCTHLKYPFIIHHNMTYIPLTQYWCTSLGLTYGFTSEDGLFVANYTAYIKTDSNDLDQSGKFQSEKNYTATIPDYPIHINGMLIDNHNESYPFIQFNGITYLPLTWDYVKDVFGWDLVWKDDVGLSISSEGILNEFGPGEQYDTVTIFTLEAYDAYSIVQSNTTSWIMGTEADEYGHYVHYNEGQNVSYYKLDYMSDSIDAIESAEVADKPYGLGSVQSDSVTSQFLIKDNQLYNGNEPVLDLTESLQESRTIDSFRIDKYDCNSINVYDVEISFKVDGESVPAPYTPRKSYALIGKGTEKLALIEDWPQDHSISSVYCFGKDGVYICSDSRYFDSARFNNGQGLVMMVHSDLSTSILNDQWPNWYSVTALGMDYEGNLYLKNTWFPEYTLPNQYNGTVSLVNDGYFKLDLTGKLTKIYPFIEANHITVTPTGDMYIDASWIDAIIHLQTEKWFTID